MEFILAFGKSVVVVLGILLIFIFILFPLILVLVNKVDPFLSWFGEKIVEPYYKWLVDKFDI